VEFDKAKESLLNQQNDIKSKIDYINSRNLNEKLITYLKEDVNKNNPD
jgi:hypothetical protein